MANSTPTSAASIPSGRGFVPFLIFTAIACGGMVMVLEVLGSRVVGPFYGVSLYVWTSLITVTLIALAAGYAVGGYVADLRPTATVLYGAVGLAGALTLLIPWLRVPVLTACQPLGLKAGAFLSTFLLFGGPLFLMGWVSPYVVRIATKELRAVGRTVGSFYALSTLGSVIGTVATGFFLIGALGVDGIIRLVGTVLVVLSVSYFVIYARKPGGAALLVLLLLPAEPSSPIATHLPDGTAIREVESIETYYGSLKVVDYSYGPRHIRELLIDGLLQGSIDVPTGMPIHSFPYLCSFIARALHPEGKTALVIGLGAGLIPRWFEGLGIETTVIDIDPEIVGLARRHFGFRGNRVLVGDARQVLGELEERFDYIVLDVFSGDVTPSHLLSIEAFASIAAHLTPRGVLAVNAAGAPDPKSPGTAAVLRTMMEVFDSVRVFPATPIDRTSGAVNLEIFAHQGPRRNLTEDAIVLALVHPMARDDVRGVIGRELTIPTDLTGVVLTDEYNPIDVLDAAVREEVRQTILANNDWSTLLQSNSD